MMNGQIRSCRCWRYRACRQQLLGAHGLKRPSPARRPMTTGGPQRRRDLGHGPHFVALFVDQLAACRHRRLTAQIRPPASPARSAVASRRECSPDVVPAWCSFRRSGRRGGEMLGRTSSLDGAWAFLAGHGAAWSNTLRARVACGRCTLAIKPSRWAFRPGGTRSVGAWRCAIAGLHAAIPGRADWAHALVSMALSGRHAGTGDSRRGTRPIPSSVHDRPVGAGLRSPVSQAWPSPWRNLVPADHRSLSRAIDLAPKALGPIKAEKARSMAHGKASLVQAGGASQASVAALRLAVGLALPAPPAGDVGARWI